MVTDLAENLHTGAVAAPDYHGHILKVIKCIYRPYLSILRKNFLKSCIKVQFYAEINVKYEIYLRGN